MPASENDHVGWSEADRFTVVIETAGLNPGERSAYCRERCLNPRQMERSLEVSQDAKKKTALTFRPSPASWY